MTSGSGFVPDQIRDGMGVGSVLKAEKGDHKGTTKRPSEVKRLDGYKPDEIKRKSIADFIKERAERERADRLKRLEKEGLSPGEERQG